MSISDLNIHVNQERCIACGICVDRCIMDNLRLHIAPCRIECPLRMNCQGYLGLLSRGEGERAAEELRKYTPFAGILGRVCHHPCESVCKRAENGDGAVNIRGVKRFLADNYSSILNSLPESNKDTGLSVAVIGSGPAGMTAGYELRALGHSVTVFDAASEPGGLLRWGIPSFRLLPDEVGAAVDMLQRMGIVFKTGSTLGRDLDFEEVLKRFGAVLLAVGAGSPSTLNIPGEDLSGVRSGMDFLRDAKDGKIVSPGDSVIIIGGGNAAMDAALTCARLGSTEIRVVCLEQRDQMPAFQMEIQEALEMGVHIDNGRGPRRFVDGENGRVRVEMSRCLSLYDASGEFRPVLEDGDSTWLEADCVLVAIGQQGAKNMPELGFDAGIFRVDSTTLQSYADPRVFCSGDAVTGPGSVVNAMAQGRQAAESMHRFLRQEGMEWGRDVFVENGFLTYTEPDLSAARGNGRLGYERLPVGERPMDREVETYFSPEAARMEAERCLGCGRAAECNRTCWFCLPCEIDCPEEAIEVRIPYLAR